VSRSFLTNIWDIPSIDSDSAPRSPVCEFLAQLQPFPMSLRAVIAAALSLQSSWAQAQCILHFAGTGVTGHTGDGGPASLATLSSPQLLNSDGAGGALILETISAVVRRVFSNGTITTLAGTGVWGYDGDYKPATTAALRGTHAG
jgi:hypothetical protein